MRIAEEYVKIGSMEKVAEKLGIPLSTVRETIEKECGILYGRRSLCRVYLLLKDRCFLSIAEAQKTLSISRQGALKLFHLFREAVPSFKVATLRKTVWRFKRIPTTYIVKDTDDCVKEFVEYLKAELGVEKVERWIVWS
jgi:hypothetical protein